MWIRFWYKTSSFDEEESKYAYVNDRETDESLYEISRELVPNWVENVYKHQYGFEKINKLPEDIRLLKLKSAYQKRLYIDEMIKILEGS